MGLELSEIAIRVEERFGIQLDDGPPYDHFASVGSLYQHILGKLAVISGPNCRTVSEFLRIRKGLAAAAGCAPVNIRLDTPVQSILPWNSRRAKWRKLQRAMQWLPALQLPSRAGKSIVAAIFVGAFGVSLYLVAQKAATDSSAWYLLIPSAIWALLCAFIVCIPMFIVTRPFARTVPSNLRTPRHMLLYAYPRITHHCRPPSRTMADDEVWRALVSIIENTIGRHADTIRPEHRFIEDLDCG